MVTILSAAPAKAQSVLLDFRQSLSFESSDCFDELKIRRPSLTPFYHTQRLPSPTAPWPEPPSPTSKQAFEFFPFLPDSVRRKIWTFALPGPRVIEIQYTNKQHEFRSALPTLLRVNREARSVVLMHYELATASRVHDIESALRCKNLCYVSFEKDTFCPIISFRSYVTGEWKVFLRTLPNSDRIQRLGLPKRCFLFPTPACIPLLLQYSSLKEVAVLADLRIDHRLRKGVSGEVWWELDEGEVLPTVREWDEREENEAKEQVFKRYVIIYMDKVRDAWREKCDWKLRFVYKRVCWGGQCWEDGSEVGIDENPDLRRVRRRKAVRRIMGYPQSGVARVMMLVM